MDISDEVIGFITTLVYPGCADRSVSSSEYFLFNRGQGHLQRAQGYGDHLGTIWDLWGPSFEEVIGFGDRPQEVIDVSHFLSKYVI